MLVDVPGDGDVSPDAVALDGESVAGVSLAGLFFEESPDVESVAAGAYFDVVPGVLVDVFSGGWREVAFVDAVVEVYAADSVA